MTDLDAGRRCQSVRAVAGGGPPVQGAPLPGHPRAAVGALLLGLHKPGERLRGRAGPAGRHGRGRGVRLPAQPPRTTMRRPISFPGWSPGSPCPSTSACCWRYCASGWPSSTPPAPRPAWCSAATRSSRCSGLYLPESTNEARLVDQHRRPYQPGGGAGLPEAAARRARPLRGPPDPQGLRRRAVAGRLRRPAGRLRGRAGGNRRRAG